MKDALCYYLCYILGLRKQEVVPLLYSDIDLDKKIVSITKAVHWEKNRPYIKKTKNEEIRNVPILDIIFNNVKELKSKHSENDLIFTSATTNSLMSEESMRRLLEHALFEINKLYKQDQLLLLNISNEELKNKENEIEIKIIKFTYHQLRHTYVCMLHKAGIPVKEAQYLTGHKTLNVLLNIYTHLDDEDKENATNKLNNLLKI